MLESRGYLAARGEISFWRESSFGANGRLLLNTRGFAMFVVRIGRILTGEMDLSFPDVITY